MYWGTSVERGNTTNMLMFIRTGIDVNKRLVHSGAVPLHVCARFGHLDAAQILLMAGAAYDLPDDLGYTPIQTAARYNGSVDVLLLFLKYGADGYEKNAYGYSALDYARSYGTHACIHEYTISKKWRVWSRERIKSREKQLLQYVWTKCDVSCDLRHLLDYL
jgi:hypothetical protein